MTLSLCLSGSCNLLLTRILTQWASDHEGAGATFALTWSSPVTATRFVLYDRPNLNDQARSLHSRTPSSSLF